VGGIASVVGSRNAEGNRSDLPRSGYRPQPRRLSELEMRPRIHLGEARSCASRLLSSCTPSRPFAASPCQHLAVYWFLGLASLTMLISDLRFVSQHCGSLNPKPAYAPENCYVTYVFFKQVQPVGKILTVKSCTSNA